ncbi:TRAP transporter small permease [Thermotoga profunda]|uniref:TRAP transporter small permease n=1 Tax=Thermotoga profunda TaxID=1508420 RepID=UPI000597479C|nr:TRAP transporter small permease [Thermotoga profunda]
MKKLDQYLLAFEKTAAKILIIVMIVFIFMSGIARFLKHPMNWAVDMSTFMFAWACFFAVDVAWRNNRMMSVDLLVKRLSPRAQKIIRLINYFIISAFLVYLIIWGFRLTYTTRFRTFAGIPNFSYSWVNVSVPIGAILTLRTTIIKIITELRKTPKKVQTEGAE